MDTVRGYHDTDTDAGSCNPDVGIGLPVVSNHVTVTVQEGEPFLTDRWIRTFCFLMGAFLLNSGGPWRIFPVGTRPCRCQAHHQSHCTTKRDTQRNYPVKSQTHMRGM